MKKPLMSTLVILFAVASFGTQAGGGMKGRGMGQRGGQGMSQRQGGAGDQQRERMRQYQPSGGQIQNGAMEQHREMRQEQQRTRQMTPAMGNSQPR